MSTHQDERLAARYFFLSYAHTAPLAGAAPEPTDYWVGKVFEDLSAAVRRAAGPGVGGEVGFFEGAADAGTDWKALARRGLGTAEVFVPLYSPRYFAMSWPGREWACFAGRLGGEPPDEPSPHILPVLWAPLAGTALPARAPDPLAAFEDVPEYAGNGLRALAMLNLYSEQYTEVVARLGRRIVQVAKERHLPPSPVPALDEVASAFRFKGIEDDFVVAVAAPTRASAPPGRAVSWYGENNTDWRPFGEREQLRLADHAVTVAERLNFSTSVLGMRAAADETAATPAVVLIDPWIAVETGGVESDALRNLRRLYTSSPRRGWTLPLVVVNAEDPESAARLEPLTTRLTRILEQVAAPLAEGLRGASTVVTSIEDFARAMPTLVAEAERRYLRYSPDFTDGRGAGGRPARDGQAPPSGGEMWERRNGTGA